MTYEPEFDLRQNADSELEFVLLINYGDSTDIFIDAYVDPGVYSLVLESFDWEGTEETLAIDIVTVEVKQIGHSDTLVFFLSELKLQTIVSGQFKEWKLPEIETNGQDF